MDESISDFFFFFFLPDPGAVGGETQAKVPSV